MTTPVKIKIECDDPLLNAAIASAIADGLQRNDFDNVMVKTLMVYQEVRMVAGAPQNFAKKNIINKTLGMDVSDEPQVGRPPLIMTELQPARMLGHPICVDTLRQRQPDLLHAPVLLDMGIEPTDYAKRADAFLKGES